MNNKTTIPAIILWTIIISTSGYFVVDHIQNKTSNTIETKLDEQKQITTELQNIIYQQEYLTKQIEQLKSKHQGNYILLDEMTKQVRELESQISNNYSESTISKDLSDFDDNGLTEAEVTIEEISLQIIDVLTLQETEELTPHQEEEKIYIGR